MSEMFIKRELPFVSKSSVKWRKILEHWQDINDEMYKFAKDEKDRFAPYAYRERPNVGALAAAASRAGWVALEECWIEKQKGEVKSAGRADLLIWKKDGHERIEAKFTSRSFEELPGRIWQLHAEAIKDVQKLGSHSKWKNVAITFIAPRVLSPDSHAFHNKLPALLDFCRTEMSPDFMAASFPGFVSRKSSDKKSKDTYSAGVIVIGTVC